MHLLKHFGMVLTLIVHTCMCTAGKRRSGPISSIFKAKAGHHQEYVERIESLCGRLLDAVDLEQRERAIELLAKVVIANANPTYATYDDTGDNALHCAAKNRDTVLIELLLSAGADPLKKNDDNKYAYDLLPSHYEYARDLLDIAEQQRRLATSGD